MSAALTIRPFKSSDTNAIVSLFRETVHTIGARYYSPEQVAAWAPLDEPTADRDIVFNSWQTKLETSHAFVAEKRRHPHWIWRYKLRWTSRSPLRA